MKYVDADKLKTHIEAIMEILWDRLPDADKEHPTDIELRDLGMYMALEGLIDNLDSLQQDKESVELELCSQIWWEERGWIMIPPDATIEGIDSLLKQVRKKLQQEQSEVNLVAEYDEQFDSDPVYGKLINRNAGIAVARYFWNKGFNARKEEGK